MKRWISCLLLCALCICLATGCTPALSEPSLSERVGRAAAGLKALAGVGENDPILEEALFPAGDSTSDWLAMALAMQGAPEDYDAYLERLSESVTRRYAASGRLDRARATEWHRIALTVLALGGDPRAFGRNPDGSPIDLVADGTYNYIGDALDFQGLNGLLYALLVLDAKGYAVPEDSRYTREDLLAAILAQQNADGGFGLEVGNSDVDITAMALQALAPYAQQAAREAVRDALAYLSGIQNADGGFLAYGTGSSESSAQVVMALCALGLDPDAEAAFCKSGGSALDALLSYQLADGSFAHTEGEEGNIIATEQALLALTAAEKYYAGQGSLFDFSTYTAP